MVQILIYVKSINKKEMSDGEWQLDQLPVTFSVFFSKKQKKEDIKSRAVIGTFPVFSEEKADTLSMQKPTNLSTYPE